MARADIGLADFLLATVRLGADATSLRARIADLLGLTEAVTSYQLRAAAEGGLAGEPPPAPPSPALEAPPEDDVRAGDVRNAASTPLAIPLRVESLASEAVDVPWPENLPPAPNFDEPGHRPLPAPPLVTPKLERGATHLLLASRREGGEVDVDAVLDLATRLEIVDPLPQLLEWSVHGGADFLIDVSSALAPFGDDVDRLVRLGSEVGGDPTRVFYYEHCPGRSVFSEGEETYRPTRKRTVVVGAFGAGPHPSTAGPEEWNGYLQQLRSSGVDVIGVCPFEGGFKAFAPTLPMIFWSETTSTGDVVRAIPGR